MSHCTSFTEHITVRGLRYGIRHWGDAKAPIVFFLHGWMDSSATFQFVVDTLKTSWHVIAPDWRGYGQSQWLSRPYWFSDYYADLNDPQGSGSGHSGACQISSSIQNINLEFPLCHIRSARISIYD